MIKLNVWGGAGEHGRSAYLLSGSRFRLLLDCGVKKEGTGEYPLIEPEIVPQLDAVLLSHAHEDHSVAIPLLYKMGYQGEVWTTRETREQLDTYFSAWRRNTERAGHTLPYDEADEQAIRYRFLEDEAQRGTWFNVVPGVAAVWGRSGHLAGSVWFGLKMEGKRIFYSGDYTSESLLLQEDDAATVFMQADMVGNSRALAAPVSRPTCMSNRAAAVNGGQAIAERAASSSRNLASVNGSDMAESSSVAMLDLAIVDAAYGTDQDTQADKLKQLDSAIRTTIAKGGKVLLPMPAVGRGQEIILWAQRQFQGTPIIVEQKLVDGMKQLFRVPDWLRKQEERVTLEPLQDRIGSFLNGQGWELTTTREDRERLLDQHGASLWFIPDGMMQSSLARWYYGQLSAREENLILLTGHVAAGTFAQKLLLQPKEYGQCKVRKIRYKVHQGWKDVERMLHRIPARHTVLVHTDRPETDRLRAGLRGNSPFPEADIHSMSPGDELSF
ncbi:MBL fold metallo-hydrolase [Paenibacillus sp. QZ-Y1]|uniref:MBL fold metallo-hydrolase n=1 Tax=Paenibacillus sp. QZ-Y1 TaxID=3414511 RepID=UPI003F7B23D3